MIQETVLKNDRLLIQIPRKETVLSKRSGFFPPKISEYIQIFSSSAASARLTNSVMDPSAPGQPACGRQQTI